MTVTLTKHPTALLNKIGSYVCQALIYIQQQQPELLLDKYRSISWRDNSNQSRLKAKLIEVIGNIEDWESLVVRVEGFIKALLISDARNTPVIIKLQEKIRQLNPNILELNSSNHQQDINSTNKESNIQSIDESSDNHQKFNNNKTVKSNINQNQQDSNSIKDINQEYLCPTTELKDSANQPDINDVEQQTSYKVENKQQIGIAVLLLDVENIQITPETEQFLTTVSTNPIQIKIAFANWQTMGKKDIEYHNRGYDLIHVPRGKDNADGKMIAFGLTIDQYYPKVKEVVLCSSDKVMNNLCNQLQEKGLDVYQVSQQQSNLTIFNSKTNQTQIHTILPSIEQLLCQIKDIIKEQEAQTSNQWIKLSQICKLFKEKYNFGLNKVLSQHPGGKTVENIFLNKPEFVIHQIPEHPELYITLFKMPTQQNINSKILTFENKSELEESLVKIITKLVGKTPNNYIPIYTIGERFDKQYSQGITKILKELDINGNFVNFLESCSSFQLKKTGTIWQVALK